MMENNNIFETLLERAEDFIKTNVELLKLKAVDKIQEGASTAASKILGMFFFIMFFLLASIGLSLWLGDVLGNSWYGFFAVAAFFGLLWVLLFFVKQNWLKKLVGNSIIKSMLN